MGAAVLLTLVACTARCCRACLTLRAWALKGYREAWISFQVGPPKPPSPVPEGVEEEVSPAKVAVKDDSAPVSASRGTADSDSFAQERSRLKSDLQKVGR